MTGDSVLILVKNEYQNINCALLNGKKSCFDQQEKQMQAQVKAERGKSERVGLSYLLKAHKIR